MGLSRRTGPSSGNAMSGPPASWTLDMGSLEKCLPTEHLLSSQTEEFRTDSESSINATTHLASGDRICSLELILKILMIVSVKKDMRHSVSREG